MLEQLRIIVSADSKGAQKEFEQLGQKAERELGKAERSTEILSGKLQSIGSTVALGGAAILGGFGLLAKAADDADIQVTKLENSIKGSDQTFENNGKNLVDLAESIQQVTAADADAIIEAESLLVQFGLTEDQINVLTPLIVDLSRKMNIDMVTAAKAVGKAVDGNAGQLGRYGISFDEAALKADAFGTVVEGLQSKVGGFARQEGETFSGQLERLKNNLGDIGENVGAGAADVLGSFVGSAADLTKQLNELNPGILTAAGGLGATVGIVGTVAGGLTFAAGAALDFRNKVQEGRTALVNVGEDGSKSMTKIGKAIAGITVVGAVAGIIETVATVANSVNDIDTQTTAAFDNLRNNLDGTGQDAAAAFANLVEVQDKSAEFAGIWQGLGQEIQLGGAKADIEEFTQAFDDLLETAGPAGAQKVLDGLRESNAALDQNSEQYKANARFIEDSQKKVDTRKQALVEATIAERDQKRAIEESIDAYDEETGTLEGLNNQLKRAKDFLGAATTEFDAGAAAAKGFREELERQTIGDDQISSALSFNEALQDVSKTAGALPEDLDASRIALEGIGEQSTDTGEKALEAFLKIGDATRDLLGSFIAVGDEEGARALAERLRTQIIEALKAQGITDPQQINELLGLAGLQDVQVDAAIRFGNAEEELFRVQTLIALFETQLREAPPEVLLKVGDQVLQGDLEGARTTLQNWVTASSDDPATSQVGIAALLEQFPDLKPTLDAAQQQADRNPVVIKLEPKVLRGGAVEQAGRALEAQLGIDIPFIGGGLAKGGKAEAGTAYVVGEQGPELFMPRVTGTVVPNNKLGGNTLNLTQNIQSNDPILTAAEVVRRQRDAEFLAGV